MCEPDFQITNSGLIEFFGPNQFNEEEACSSCERVC
jgi:hypothetical protein